MTLPTVFNQVFCLYEQLIMRQIDAACSLYTLIFLAMYFVKMKHIQVVSDLQCGSNNNNNNTDDELLIASNDALQMHQLFEDGFSYILFFKVLFDYLTVLILLFFASNYFNAFRSGTSDLYYMYYLISRQMFSTSSMLLLVSCLQEKIEDQLDILRHQVYRRLFQRQILSGSRIFDGLMVEVFTHKATVWNILDISRGTLLTLASSYTLFPVLFIQITNGALKPV